MRVTSPADREEREACAVADQVMRSESCRPDSAAATATVPPGDRVLRDVTAIPDPAEPTHDVEKAGEQPGSWPPQEQPKTADEASTDLADKLTKGGGEAGDRAFSMLADDFSKTWVGQRLADWMENDPVVRFFTKNPIGIVTIATLGAGGLTAGTLAKWADRVPGAGNVEKIIDLQFSWDLLSPPSGYILKTPWVNSPRLAKPTPAPAKPLQDVVRPFRVTVRGQGICPRSSEDETVGTLFIYLWLRHRQSESAVHVPRLRAPNWDPSPFTPLFNRIDSRARNVERAAIEQGLESGSSGLDPGDRAFMERKFGIDLGQVRVHTGHQAAAAAAATNANAFTVGHDVVFGNGKYNPGTNAGRRLLAHELTHVVQQVSHSSTDTGNSNLGVLSLSSPAQSSRTESGIRRVARSAVEVPAPLLHTYRRSPCPTGSGIGHFDEVEYNTETGLFVVTVRPTFHFPSFRPSEYPPEVRGDPAAMRRAEMDHESSKDAFVTSFVRQAELWGGHHTFFCHQPPHLGPFSPRDRGGRPDIFT